MKPSSHCLAAPVNPGLDTNIKSWFKYGFRSWISVHWLAPWPYRCSVALPAFTSCNHAKPLFDRHESAFLHYKPWPNREVTVSPHWTQPMLVYYGFTPWSYGCEVLQWCPRSPRNKPALVSLLVSPGCIKIINTTGATPRWLPFNMVYPIIAVLPNVATVVVPGGSPRCPN
jgi:hypothetical protein